MAIDDPGAIQVVRRELDAHAVTRKDADSEPPHLAGDVAQHDPIHVVELDAEHRIGESFDDLSLQFDLFFLRHSRRKASSSMSAGQCCFTPPPPLEGSWPFPDPDGLPPEPFPDPDGLPPEPFPDPDGLPPEPFPEPVPLLAGGGGPCGG